jgi:hypothetical protein
MMMSRIRQYLLPANEAISGGGGGGGGEQLDKKELFCLIKTTPGALASNKTLTTFKVWASRCSNYRFITLIPEDKLAMAVKYGNHAEISTPFYLTQPEGLKVEVYGKITDKLYSAMRYVYSRFNDYKWYFGLVFLLCTLVRGLEIIFFLFKLIKFIHTFSVKIVKNKNFKKKIVLFAFFELKNLILEFF